MVLKTVKPLTNNLQIILLSNIVETEETHESIHDNEVRYMLPNVMCCDTK